MKEKKKLKVFTAFSGYDSQCLALKRLHEMYPDFDYELVGWSEIDPYAIQAHNILFPEAADLNHGDISTVDWSQVPDFDLFTYSSPCQDFSLAGKQRGGEEGSGTRSSLLWECKRCIEAKRPKYLLLENVTTLVSKKFLPLLMKWIETVRSFGYESFYTTLNAKYFNVPQNRDRLFLVSIRKESPDEVINYNFPNPQEITRYAEDLLESRGTVDEKYYIDQEKVREWARDNRQRIAEYISERNGVPMEELEIVPDDDFENALEDADETGVITTPIQEENLHIDNDMHRKKKETIAVTVESQEQVDELKQDLIAAGVSESEITVEEVPESEDMKETESAEDFAEAEDARWNSANTDKKQKKEKKVKPIREYLTDEEKALRGDDVCVLRIPTPTCSDGTAPTLMATGYANADYKNFYSVGHFPKLGVLEVWRHVKKKDGTIVEERVK